MKKVLVFFVIAFILSSPVWAELPCSPVANYEISAELDPVAHTVDGKLLLEWTNTSNIPVDTILFHSYLNAFRNSSSTFLKESGNRGPAFSFFNADWPSDGWGSIDVKSVSASLINQFENADLLPTLVYIQPDDQNSNDMTVFILNLPEPVQPGEQVIFNFEFVSKLPYLGVRAAFKQNFHFVSQWFPKIGVLSDDGWNCHQYHYCSEFFADFGNYNVNLTIPDGFVVGATGELINAEKSGEKTVYLYQQDCVHDFAFTAYDGYRTKTVKFESNGLPAVDIELLYLPDHEKFADRFLDAAQKALYNYGSWYIPYPYKNLTIVDVPPDTYTGSMEYPTLITVSLSRYEINGNFGPEWTVLHEAGHQFWYGLVASNEFEEPWIDEGFTSFSDVRAINAEYGYIYEGKYYLQRKGFKLPWTFTNIQLDPMDRRMHRYRSAGYAEAVNKPAWQFASYLSYKAHAYDKPAMMLATLENLVGPEVFAKIMSTFAERYMYKHPHTADFIQVVNEISPKPMDWFLEQVLYEAKTVDFVIDQISSKPVAPVRGIDETGNPVAGKSNSNYESRIIVKRNGGLVVPVNIKVTFENGEELSEIWDADAPVYILTYTLDSPVHKVEIDPDNQIVLDMDQSNNIKYRQRNSFAAFKWGARWLFWLQHLLETVAVFS